MTEQEKQELRRYLNVIKRAVSFAESILENGDGGLMEAMIAQEQPRIAPAPTAVPNVVPNVVFQTAPATKPPQQLEATVPAQIEAPKPFSEEDPAYKARQKHIGDLMAIDCWPEAVPQMLANKEPSEKEKNKRANMVIDMMVDRKLNGLKFLDFGCGEGHVAEQMSLRGVSKSVGYDLARKETWDNFKNAQFTTNFDDLTNGELFDIIMLYDVLDHCEDPEDIMKKVSSLISDKGVIYARCHPWTSSHAMHLHTLNPELNKAYLHLFLKWEEIYTLVGKKPMYTRIEKKPLDAYHWWFKNFEIKRERKMDSPVSEFFHVPAFKELLANEQGLKADETDAFLETMKMQFVDYILIPKK